MLGDLFARLFSSKPKEPLPPLPMHAEADLIECLRDAQVELRREGVRTVLEAMRQRRKIEAIRELREGASPRIGLKEAKDIMDAFEHRLKHPPDRLRR